MGLWLHNKKHHINTNNTESNNKTETKTESNTNNIESNNNKKETETNKIFPCRYCIYYII